MHSVDPVSLFLFAASLVVFVISIYLIRKNSHSRKGGDDYVRRKHRKTIGWILLFPAVLLLALAGLNEEMITDSSDIDTAAAAAVQGYVPPVLPKPTVSLLAPRDTWRTQLPSTNAHPFASAPSQPVSSPSAMAPFAFPALPPAVAPAPSPTPPSASATLSRAEQMAADISDATAKISANPQDADAYSTRGNLYAAKRDWEAAGRDFQSAATIDPTNAKSKFNLAEMSFMEKKYDAAKPGFVALEQDSDLGDLAAYKAFLCDLFGGQLDAASKELDAFNQVGGNASYYFANVAWSINHRKFDDARGWLRSAQRIYPPAKLKLYVTTLFEMGYMPLPPAQAN